MIYVLQVVSGKEMDVLSVLKKQQCGHPMVPRQILIERRAGKDSQRENVLIPGYVFVDTALDLQMYYRMKAVPNVIRFLGGGQPQALPTSEEEYIMLLANGDKPLLPVVFYGNGSIKSDTLKKLQGVSFNKRQRRAKVLLQLLGERHEINLAAVLEGDEDGGDAGDDTEDDN